MLLHLSLRGHGVPLHRRIEQLRRRCQSSPDDSSGSSLCHRLSGPPGDQRSGIARDYPALPLAGPGASQETKAATVVRVSKQ